jgi:hypothetical protein
MQRTRDYYLALGCGSLYRWAHFVEVPFTPLTMPLGCDKADPRGKTLGQGGP